MINDSDYEELRTRLVQDFNSYFAPSTAMDTISSLAGWKSKVMGDGSFGRIFNGPQWLDGVAIRDGVISTAKLKATMVVSNTFTTSDTANADRVEFTSAGIKTYGTISGTPNIVTAWLKTDGTGFVGSTDGTATTAALAWTNAAATGSMRNTITIGSGGKLAFGSGGADYLDNNILHFEVGSSEEAVVEIKSGAATQYGTIYGLVTGAAAVSGLHSFGTSSRAAIAFAQGGTSDALTFVSLRTLDSTGAFGGGIDVKAAGGIDFLNGGATLASFAVTDKALSLAGRLYPGTGSAAQSSRYLYDNGTDTEFIGSVKMLNGIYGGAYFPGNQATRYFSDNGAQLYASAGLQSAGAFYPTGQTSIFFDKNAGTGNARIKGANLELPDGHLQQVNFGAASGALPAATKYMPVFDLTAGALRYIPCYTSPGPWTA